MTKLTFDRDIETITLNDCLLCQEIGIAIIMDEGRKITFEVDE
jgi:hypothetical protein